MTHITVAMPTYNRGSLALEHLEWMLERSPAGVSFLVLDNASWENLDGYHTIAAMEIPAVEYVRLERNTGIHGAFTECLRLVSSRDEPGILVYCSDEDTIPPEAMEAWLHEVDWTKVAAVRGSVGCLDGPADDAYQMMYDYYEQGRLAVQNYCFQHSYMSGQCYNLDLMKRNLRLYFDEVWKWQEYMIFLLDLVAALSGDVECWSRVVALAGPTSPNQVPVEKTAYPPSHLTFGSRLDQHLAYRDGLLKAAELAMDNGIFAVGYLKACMWTLRMLTEVNLRYYGMAGMDERSLVEIGAQYTHALLDKVNGMPPELKAAMHGDLAKLRYLALEVYQQRVEDYAARHSGSGSES